MGIWKKLSHSGICFIEVSRIEVPMYRTVIKYIHNFKVTALILFSMSSGGNVELRHSNDTKLGFHLTRTDIDQLMTVYLDPAYFLILDCFSMISRCLISNNSFSSFSFSSTDLWRADEAKVAGFCSLNINETICNQQ